MRKGMVFQKTIGLGMVSCLLGLGACTHQSNDVFLIEDDVIVEDSAQQTSLDNPFLMAENDPNACAPDMEGCESSDDYLVNRFSQSTDPNRDDYLNVRPNDDHISLSRPAGYGTVSVKEKQLAKQLKAESERTTTSERTVTTKGSDEKVLYTTVAIPEELGTTKVTETTIDTTKVTKTPAEGIAVAGASGLIPLKKTTTTITETTKRVQPEKKDPASLNFEKMTLSEKIEYGNSDQDWEAKAGNTLRGLLMEWGNRAGWTVVWKLDRDYNLEAGVTFRGTFTEVSGALIRSFARATPAPIGTFHQGNRVLVINTQENENEH